MPRVAIFDDVTYDVIMTSFADLPGKFENSYIVSHSSNHNSDFTNKTKNTALSWKLVSKCNYQNVVFKEFKIWKGQTEKWQNPKKYFIFILGEQNVPSPIFEWNNVGNRFPDGFVNTNSRYRAIKNKWWNVVFLFFLNLQKL